MENKHNFMETESITKLLIKFSLPAIIGMIVNALYNVVDRIYIGNIKDIGHLGIAGVGLSFPVVILTFSFSLLIGIGGAACISLRLGEKKREKAEEYLGAAVYIASLISVVLLILFILFIDKIIYILGGSEETFHYARSYLWYLNFGVPAVIIGNVLNAVIRSDGSPKMSMATLLIGAVTNIILDPIFIFYLDMGVKGAALATIISQYLSAGWTLYYFSSKLGKMKLYKKYIIFDLEKSKEICTLGSSAFAIQIGFSLVTYSLNRTLKIYGGDISIGAMAIIQSIVTFMSMPIFGINQGILPILGYNYGAKKYKRVKEIMYKAIFMATTICIIGFLSASFLSRSLVEIFTEREELRNLSIYGLKRYTLAFPIIGFQIISSIYFQAIGKPRMSLLISSSRQILFMIPSIYILAHLFGLVGIWYAAPVADISSTFITYILIKNEISQLSKMEEEKIDRIS